MEIKNYINIFAEKKTSKPSIRERLEAAKKECAQQKRVMAKGQAGAGNQP